MMKTVFAALLIVGTASAMARAEESGGGAPSTPSAAAPTFEYAFSARVELLPPIEQGTIDGRRIRFIPISGGSVAGPKLHGKVLPGGGDWQSVGTDGLTELDARYSIKADDGTVIRITNTGVRTATPEVIERITRGEVVGPDDYYFRTAARFLVGDGPHEWMRRTMFIARGIRMPDHVVVDFYEVK